jgi:hypothetical protein
MRVILVAALVAATAACGAYSFPGSTQAETGTVSGTVTVVPCAPVEQAGQPCKGLIGTGLAVVFTSGSNTAYAIVDSNGHYLAQLATGTWKVSFKGIARIISGPPTITVPAGGTVTADYVVDSGIRMPGPAA